MSRFFQHQKHQQQRQNPYQNPSTSTVSREMVDSSPTLLSHLLANKSGYEGKIRESVIQRNVQVHMSSGASMVDHPSPSSSHRHQHKSRSPKNATESLNQNIPLMPNSGAAKSMTQMDHDHSTNSNSSGITENLSQPLLPHVPPSSSPPKGPPLIVPEPSFIYFRPKNDADRVLCEKYRKKKYQQRRQASQIVENNRRRTLKNAITNLRSVIPQFSHYQYTNVKVTETQILGEGAEYIRQLKLDRAQLQQDIESCRQQVDFLKSSSILGQRTNKMKELFDQWVRRRTADDWRFSIFSIIVRPLLDSYNNLVCTASLDELCRTVLAWVDQHCYCSLVDARQAVFNCLRHLCTTTDILTNPASLPEAVVRAALDRFENSNSESR